MSSPAARASHTETVSAPFSTVLAALVEKVYKPELHVPAVISSRIVADAGGRGVERHMHNTVKSVDPELGDIHELITWEESSHADGRRKVCFTFTTLTDLMFEGTVTNTAEELDASSTRVTYELQWNFKADVSQEARVAPFGGNCAALMRGAVLKMKATCEA